MNILLTNYRYFISGGPERYLFNVKELLEEKRHNVIPFSVKHPRNLPSEYSQYFLSPLSDDEESITLKQLKLTPRNLVKLFDRTFLSIEARGQMKRLLNSNDVDLAYILHFLRWISPSILFELSGRKVPIVVRVSDFEYMCPGTHLLRDGEVCEICVGHDLWPSVKYKCVQNSFPLSLAHYVSMSLYRLISVLDKIDAFVCPSQFTLGQMSKAGFSRKKLFHVPTFIDTRRVQPDFEAGRYILYTGRVSPEKGVNVLLDAYEKYRRQENASTIPLYIMHTGGEAVPDLEERIKSADLSKEVVLMSGLSGQEFYSYVKNAAFTVVPSIWYENMPNAILESYAYGKPVIGSRRGGIEEVVRDGETGLLFEAGDADDLAEKIAWMAGHHRERLTMGRNGRGLVEDQHNRELHYEKLMGVFSQVR